MDHRQCNDCAGDAVVRCMACRCRLPYYRSRFTRCERPRTCSVSYWFPRVCTRELWNVGELLCHHVAMHCGEYFSGLTALDIYRDINYQQAAIWFAVNAFYGANFVSICLRCIWPSCNSVTNTIPTSQGITTQLMVALFIFWALSMPFIFIHPRNLNWYFVAKSCLVGPACFAVLIWAVVLNGGSIGLSF